METRVRAHDRRNPHGGIEHVREHERRLPGTSSSPGRETNFEDREQEEKESNEDSSETETGREGG